MATHSLKRPFSFAGSGFQQKTSNQNKEPLISNSTSPFRNYQRHTITKGFDTPKKALISDNISTKTKSPYKASMTVQEQTEKRMRNELQLITKEFIKVETILNDKTIPFQKKQLIDPDKWRKKFRFLFDREKCLNFDLVEGSHIFAKKGIVTNLEPKVIKPLGKYVLEDCANFWILFTYYNRNKIDADIEQKEKVRRQVVDNFFETEQKHSQQVLLKKWLDNILYLPDVCAAPAKVAGMTDATPASASTSKYSHMFQSHIGSNLREI